MVDPTLTAPAAGTGEAATSDEYGPIKMMRAWPADRDDDSPPDASALTRALAVHDALPGEHRPSDHEPLRNCLPGIWPTVGDLRAMLASGTVPHPDAAPDLPAGGAGLPTVEEMAQRIRTAVEDETGGLEIGYIESVEVARYALTGLPPGPDRDAALARLAERRPAAGVEPAPGRVDAGAVRAFLAVLDAFNAGTMATHNAMMLADGDDALEVAQRAHAAEGARLGQAVDAKRTALDAALDRTGDGWRPIGNEPRDGTPFMAALSNGWVVVIWCRVNRDYSRFQWYHGCSISLPVVDTHGDYDWAERCLATHWRPLPTPPSTSTGAAP